MVSELESKFEVLEIPEEVKATKPKQFLVVKVKKWWKSVASALTTNGQKVT